MRGFVVRFQILVAASAVTSVLLASCGSNSQSPESDAKAANLQLAATHRPESEIGFLRILGLAKSAYGQATSEMTKAGVRGQRSNAICNLLRKGRKATDWTGVIADVRPNSEGRGIVSIELGDGVEVRTWNNLLSDIGDDTLIEPTSPLFEQISQLSPGDPVKFSGRFFENERDCITVMDGTSVRMILTYPAFLMRFSKIEKLSADKS